MTQIDKPPLFSILTKRYVPAICLFALISGTYTGPVWVQTSTSTGGDATIRYTTDGFDLTNSSAIYTSPIQIASTSTVNAVSQKSGLSTSDISTVSLTTSGDDQYAVDNRPEATGVNMPTSNNAAVLRTLSRTGVFHQYRANANDNQHWILELVTPSTEPTTS